MAVFLIYAALETWPFQSNQAPSYNVNPTANNGPPSHTPRRTTNAKEYSWAHKLAIINRGRSVGGNDAEVKGFERLLSSIVSKCGETEQVTSDVLVPGHKLLTERGQDESLLTFTYAIDQAIPRDAKGLVNVQEVVAAYVTLRTPRQ